MYSRSHKSDSVWRPEADAGSLDDYSEDEYCEDDALIKNSPKVRNNSRIIIVNDGFLHAFFHHQGFMSRIWRELGIFFRAKFLKRNPDGLS